MKPRTTDGVSMHKSMVLRQRRLTTKHYAFVSRWLRILGLSVGVILRTPNDELHAKITQVGRRLIRQHHPDIGPGTKANDRLFARELSAYENLRKLTPRQWRLWKAHLQTVPDMEMPFAWTWDREPKLGDGYQESREHLWYT
jgi:hypothetical protein